MRGNKVSILRRRESLPAVLSRASTVSCYHPMYPSIPSIPDRESCRSITPAVRISSGLDYFLSWLPGHHGVVLSCPSPMIHDPRPSITPGCLPRLPPRPRKSSSVSAPLQRPRESEASPTVPGTAPATVLSRLSLPCRDPGSRAWAGRACRQMRASIRTRDIWVVAGSERTAVPRMRAGGDGGAHSLLL
jgi:hypothetical protein